MASHSEVEAWLSILSTGLAGLRFLKEYGIRTSELDCFVQNLGKRAIEVSAFAPPPLRDQYAPLITQVEAKLRSGIEKISDPIVSDEVVDSVLKDVTELYNLVSDIHKSTVSGFITV